MCYSAQCWAHWRRYQREFGCRIAIGDFARLYGYRKRARNVRISKAMDAAFAGAQTTEESEIWSLILEFNAEQERQLQATMFSQVRRKADAERSLQVKTTKKAQEDLRISTEKVAWAQQKLASLHRTELVDEDSRIFPGWYAPVMVIENGERVVRPMRYQCRLPTWTPAVERKYPGTYNARRDSLGSAWKQVFGYSHGIMVVNRFYENVSRHAAEGRELRPGEKETNLVLEFNPQPEHDMLVACLVTFSRGWGDEADFYSFAAITDDPPPEVAAAGHDRCIVPIKRENLEAWLQPDANNLKALQAILEDRDKPYYEHRLAA